MAPLNMANVCLTMCRIAVTACLVILLASAERVTITDGEALRGYLCSPRGTIPPNTSLVLSVPTLNLPAAPQDSSTHDFCQVENTTDITIVASDELLVNDHLDYVTVKCNGTGFGFFNVSNLSIRSVYFQNCVSSVPASAMKYVNESYLDFVYGSYSNVTSYLIFNHCYNLTLDNLLAHYSDGTPGILGVNLCGLSRISAANSTFMASISIHFVDSSITKFNDMPICNLSVSSNILTYDPLTYDQFVYDLEPTTDFPISFFLNCALGVSLAQQEYDVSTDIQIVPKNAEKDKMISVLVVFIDSSLRSTVTFQGLPKSTCTHYQGGLMPVTLAIDMITLKDHHSSMYDSPHTSVLIHNMAFPCEANQLQFFGGLTIVSNGLFQRNWINITNVSICAFVPQPLEYDTWNTLLLAQNYQSNGTLTLAVEDIYITDSYNFEYYSEHGFDHLMEFNNVTVHLQGTNIFNSSGIPASAIVSYGSNVTVSGNLTIVDNYSYRNAGIFISGSSQLFLQEPLNASFHNKGASHGNAIYAPVVYSSDGGNDDINFIHIKPIAEYSLDNLSSINIGLYFKNSSNGTDRQGTQVYAPRFNFFWKDCAKFFAFQRLTWDSVHSQFAYSTLIDIIFKEIDDYDKYTSLSNGLCYKVYGQPPWICKYIDFVYYYYIILYDIFFHRVLEVINPVYPGDIAFSTPVLKSVDGKIGAIQVMPNFRLVQATIGLETLYTAYACPDNIFESTRSVDVILTLQRYKLKIITLLLHFDCPTGFRLVKGTFSYQCRCVCLQVLQDHGYHCNISTRLVSESTPSKYRWTGLESYDNTTTLLISKYCPPHFCNTSLMSFHLDESLSDLYCLNNRTGVLCGQCRVNHSAVFGSDECRSCSNLYLFTLPMYALAGVLLVALLFALRLTVATGTILGPVFYANILGLVLDRLTEDYHGAFYMITRIAISLLNLELGFPLCLYDGMTHAVAVGLKFVFPVYLWSIVVGVIILSRYSVRLSNLISKDSVQVLATLLYLSFSSLLRMVIVVVTPTTIEQSVIDSADDTSQLTEERLVWFYNGDISYGSGIHGFYLALIFLFLLIYILPFTVFATFSHRLLRFGVVNKIRPFIDALGGPFKVKWRMWFGLRLWVTILLSAVSSALLGSHARALLTMHLGVVGAFIVLQAYVQPFKNFLMGSFDTMFMVLYLVLLESYLLCDEDKLMFKTPFVILQSIAFFALFITLCHHFWHVKLLESLRRNVLVKFRGYNAIVDEERENSEQDRLLWEAARNRDGR